jgi:UDP-N-acetylglucosamine--dolichyl-phosphate N-acetylglucosaminephosphotransferase
MEDVVFHTCTVVASAIFGYFVTRKYIPVVAKYLLTKTNLHGVDMGQRDGPRVPESLGIVAGLTYLASFVICFILSPYIMISLNILSSFSLSDNFCTSNNSDGTNGYNNALSNIAAITSITAMLILGFLDDCYDLRWRYKLMFPFAASIPLLSVYYYSYGDRTTVLVPQLIARALGLDASLNLGAFYYIFMLMFVIFCTNAINIYAGINGLEVGQTIVLSVTVILYNIAEITTKSDCDEIHVFSLKVLLPFLFCSAALYKFNRYPARVFVGDSYCYFAGMTLAVVGILGHFSEEILLFALPQVFNFIVSVPQLFKIVPCPRHRLPKFNDETGLREPSTFEFDYKKLSFLGRFVMKIYSTLGLAFIKEKDIDGGDLASDKTDKKFVSNNLTLINLWLCWFGPRTERDLCHQLLRFQAWLSFLALAFLTVKISHE